MAKNFGSGVVGGVVLIDPATGQPYKATGGGGGGVSSWNDLEDKPAVIAAGATAEAARSALGLADVASSGSYSDLTDKPTNPAAATWSTLDGKPAVIAAGATQTAAREAIDAQPAGSYLTSVPDATDTAKGVVELATIAEANSDDETLAVTPAGLKAVSATRMLQADGVTARFRGFVTAHPADLAAGDWWILIEAV